MPVLRDMEFCARDLRVSYRASPAPQQLAIDVYTAGNAQVPMAPASIGALLQAINRGAAGGIVFAPGQGFAERLSGPWDDDGVCGPDYHWTLRVAGVAPLFVRNMVEELRRVGMNQPVRAMNITGSLPLDDSDLSVREGRLCTWLDDPQRYLEAWPSPGFPVTGEISPLAASLRVVLATRITPELRESLEELAIWWLNAVRNYLSNDGMEVSMNPSKTLPRFGASRREFRALYQEFLWARAPSRALLINMLARFHEQVAPIAHLEIDL